MANILKISRINEYPDTFFYASYKSPLGKMTALYTEDAKLSHLFLQDASFFDFKHIFIQKKISLKFLPLQESNATKIHAQHEKLCEQLTRYFANQLTQFNLDIVLKGTDFQIKVWQGLLTIAYGSCCSYLSLAKQIGHDKAVRALGSANGANPLPIIIPCHRVINKNGGLGGYSGGLGIKPYLLDLENTKPMQSEK